MDLNLIHAPVFRTTANFFLWVFASLQSRRPQQREGGQRGWSPPLFFCSQNEGHLCSKNRSKQRHTQRLSHTHTHMPSNKPISLRKARRGCAAAAALKPSTTTLYIFKTGQNIYKLGCTDNVAGRMRSGRTWCPMMQLVATRRIPSNKSANWRLYENRLKNMFASKRCVNGGTEVFRFSTGELSRVKNYLDRICF